MVCDTIIEYFVFLAKNYLDHSNALLVKYPPNEIHKAYHRHFSTKRFQKVT